MLLAAVVIIAMMLTQGAPCDDAASCRQAALDAAARQDFEAFHDLAWRARQKGRADDPELMLLLARAQSLSGRPGDALVTLRRLATAGAAVDVSSEDFRRVRALPGWPEVEAMLKGAPAPPPVAPAPVAEKPAAKPASPPAPAAATPPAAPPKPAATTGPAEPLTVDAEGIDPVGFAYDRVSKRFIVGDRRTNKLLAVDEVFRRTSDMVSARSGGFIGLTALEIDRARGDLWIANSAADRSTVHKLQLVSGRVLFSIPVDGRRIVDLAVSPSGAVFVLDALKHEVLRVNGERVDAVVNVIAPNPSALVHAGDALYVAHPEGLLHVDAASGSVRALAAPSGTSLAGITRLSMGRRGLIAAQTHEGRTQLVSLRVDGRARVTGVDIIEERIAGSGAFTVDGDAVVYLTHDEPPIIRRARLR